MPVQTRLILPLTDAVPRCGLRVPPPVHLPRSRRSQPIDGIRAIELALPAVLRVCLIDGAEAVLQAEVDRERRQGHAEPCRGLHARAVSVSCRSYKPSPLKV